MGRKWVWEDLSALALQHWGKGAGALANIPASLPLLKGRDISWLGVRRKQCLEVRYKLLHCEQKPGSLWRVMPACHSASSCPAAAGWLLDMLFNCCLPFGEEEQDSPNMSLCINCSSLWPCRVPESISTTYDCICFTGSGHSVQQLVGPNITSASKTGLNG